jgi:signal transduction histidine kinase
MNGQKNDIAGLNLSKIGWTGVGLGSGGILAFIGGVICWIVSAPVWLIALFLILAFLLVFSGLLLFGFTLKKGRGDLEKQRIEQAKAKAEADKAQAVRLTFYRNMAHDILTPIYGIQGMTNIASDNLQTLDTVNRCLSNISESADHLLSLVNNVLDVTPLESGKVELKKEAFSVLDILTSLSGIVQGNVESTAVGFRTDFKDVLHPQVLGDPGQLKRALLNFLDNAVKLTPEGKVMSFTARESQKDENGGTYTFEIATTGQPLSDALLSCLNNQNSSANFAASEGAELSLRVAYSILHEMGATLKANNLANGGNCVSVILPLSYVQKEAIAHGKNAYTPNLLNKRVLLVEDNAINQAIAFYLLKPTQADVALAKNGQEAVEKFLSSKEGSFSLILMDISMPIMDGYEATKRIRSSMRKGRSKTFRFSR